MIFRSTYNWFGLVEIFVFISAMLITLQNRPVSANNKRVCGYIDFGSGTSNARVDVYEGQGISASTKFEDIYKNFTTTSTLVRVEDDDCFIEICGNPTILANKEQRVIVPTCTRFSTSLTLTDKNPFQLQYEATSISCGCKKTENYPNCEKEDCQNLPFNGTGVCAVLYQDKKCNNCNFDGILLSHNDTFSTHSNAVIRSVFVHSDCLLKETAFGYSEYSPDHPIQNFIPVSLDHTESNDIVPIHTRRGQDFFCTCPKRNLETIVENSNKTAIDKTADTKSEVSYPLAWGLGSFGILVVLLTLSLIFKRYWLTNKPRLIIPKSDIIKFRKGIANAIYLNEEDDSSAPGVLQACYAPYNNKDLEISIDDLEFNPSNLRSILGNGMFGIVFKGKYKNRTQSSGKVCQDVAIKTLKPFCESGYIKSIMNEVKVLAYLGSHPNIVQLIGACTNNLAVGEVYIILELCPNGSLKNYLNSIKTSLPKHSPRLQPNPLYPEYLDINQEEQRIPDLDQEWLLKLFQWSQEIATGMQFLTEKHVLHIDLAARNVLLTYQLVAKISDFGLSRKLYSKQEYTKNSREPVPTRGNALECLTRKKYSIKSDMWSFGILLWEIFSLGDDPYGNLECQEIIDFLNDGNRLARPSYATTQIYENTMLRCWDQELEKRPCFADMRDYFQKILLNYESEVVNS